MIRLFGHYVSKLFLLLGLMELALFFGSMVAGFYIRHAMIAFDPVPAENFMAVAAVYTAIMSGSLTAMGLYQKGLQARADLVVRLALAFISAAMAISLVIYAFPALGVGRGVFGLALLISFVGILGLREFFFLFADAEQLKHRVLVLGTGRSAAVVRALEERESGFRIVAFVKFDDKEEEIPESLQVKLEDSLLSMAFQKGIDDIVVAVDDRRRRLPVDDILDCKMSGIRIYDLLTFFEKETSKVNIDLLYPSWIVFSSGFHIGAFAQHGKRILDLFVSLVMLVLFSPIMLLVAVASLIESRGRSPVFFEQVRVGRYGKPFKLYKFRSMRPDAESDGVARWASKNDERITGLGRFIRKTRMDELPQLINVLKGEMSLVGPRPERPEFVDGLAKSIPYYQERHRVKPGLTGWAQLCYQYGSTVDDTRHKLEYDLYYVKNASFFLDLIILLQTVEVVLMGKGAR